MSALNSLCFPSFVVRGMTPRPGAPASLILVLTLLGACSTPQLVESPGPSTAPQISAGRVRSSDGYRLPLRVWSPDRESASDAPATASATGSGRAIVALALHGFNDYGHAFAPLARSLAAAGVCTYAVDQRGFGATAHRGRWHGSRRLIEDLHILVALLRKRHPGARLVLIGESMGGAVILAALANGPVAVDSVVLIAPAVWSRSAMPWHQRLALDAMARIAPAMRLTGEGIRIRPSDNTAILHAMSADPLIVKATRIDALWGVTNLMDLAVGGAERMRTLDRPMLLLYGERDEVIPPRAFCRLLDRLPREAPRLRLVLYKEGWHMLARDLQRGRVHQDVISWLRDPKGPLPSGEEIRVGGGRIRAFCGDSAPKDP